MNGLNDVKKQQTIKSFLLQNRIDVLFFQEHNVKNPESLDLLNTNFDVYLNSPVLLKGGTGILLSNRLQYSVISEEKDAEGKILSLRICFGKCLLQFVSIYAPSGSTKKREREVFFDDELCYYLRGNTDNLVLGGDFNCIISSKDCSKHNTYLLSSSLKDLTQDLKLKDIYAFKNVVPTYTYIKDEYGARLYRNYIDKLFNHIVNVDTIPVTFSDHIGCVVFEVNINPNMKVWKGIWKMNVSLLQDPEVVENFKTFWAEVRKSKSSYLHFEDWWESAKLKIKSFFIKAGKENNRYRFGLLNYFERCLKIALEKASVNSVINYTEIEELRSKINSIKSEISEGVKIRSRLQEQLEGEKLSPYLLSKQKVKSRKMIIEEMVTENVGKWKGGEIITNTDAIAIYVKDYYENLMSHESNYDAYEAQKFLDLIPLVITENENRDLIKEPSIKEIENIVKCMKNNKSPGNDGIPAEFYKKLWYIIGHDVLEMVKHYLRTYSLTKTQKEGVVRLTPKDGDLKLLKNWRPICMLNVDYKILTKLVCNRLSVVLKDIISSEQFCIPGKSIIECNTLIRDVMYYANESLSKCAMISLDWSRAFDRVSIKFVLDILKSFGFHDRIIQWVSGFYENITSSVIINGLVTKSYAVYRSVRQGCPLSMSLFAVYLDPFYRMVKSRLHPFALSLPNKSKLSLFGYADDSNIFLEKEEGLKEMDKVITDFEKACGALLNRNKTWIYGMGQWSNKVEWDLPWIEIKTGIIKVLGIYFSNDYEECVSFNWNSIKEKICKRLRLMYTRRLTLMQKSILINSLICSKAWYLAHIYPMPMNIFKECKKIIFGYIWNNGYQPIKQDTLYMDKNSGGIGLINILYKSKSMLVSSFLKVYTEESFSYVFAFYYMNIFMNGIIDKRSIDMPLSFTSTPYYRDIVKCVRVLLHCKNFPFLKNKNMYSELKVDGVVSVVEKYPCFKWDSIWKNINANFINPYDRNIIFKYIHEALPSKRKLYQIGVINNSNCNICNVEDTLIHTVYFCEKNNRIVSWLKDVLKIVCSINSPQMLKILSFDFPCTKRKERNAAIVIITAYIVQMWINRDLVLNFEILKEKVIGKILAQRYIILESYGKKCKMLFCKMFLELNTNDIL